MEAADLTPRRDVCTPDWNVRPGYGELVMRDVAREHGTTVHALRHGPRTQRLVIARCEAARRLTDLGYGRTLVGRIMRRDHTTVCWYLGTGHRHREPLHRRVSK